MGQNENTKETIAVERPEKDPEVTQRAGDSPHVNIYGEIEPETIPLWRSSLIAPSGQAWVLNGDRVTIGRVEKGQGWLPTIDLTEEEHGHTVSRRHAILTRWGMLWQVTEGKQAINGTYIDDERLQPGQSVILKDGDSLRLGWVRLTYHQGCVDKGDD